MDEFYRKLARAITHYVYRNTKIEDYHSENVVMDLNFYKKVYKQVYAKMVKAERFTKYIIGFARREKEGKSLGAEAFNLIKEEDVAGFVPFYKQINWNSLFGKSWDEAELIDVKVSGTLARFILDGEFKKHCFSGSHLDDNAMKEINKDIHNRVYSLLINGYFD